MAFVDHPKEAQPTRRRLYDHVVSQPGPVTEWHYEPAGRLLAQALEEPVTTGEPDRSVLHLNLHLLRGVLEGIAESSPQACRLRPS
ncbi:hypothetical protein ACIP6X_28485 [Streptomyces coeruleorubidus]|uniref:hypothetical protein n=1 Tax=Streptomyces coeruleorubidus TaxID=116188 RepID=UPI0037FD7F69